MAASKGGVGKTTSAVNLAMGLSLAGYSVLLIDADTQGLAGFMLGMRPEAGLAELVTREVEAAEAIVPARDKLWFLAGGKSLAAAKRFIQRQDFGGETVLAEFLGEVDADFEYVVVDTAPGWDTLTVNTLFYVTEILAPVSMDLMSLQGLNDFVKSVASIQAYRADVALAYVLPTFFGPKEEKSKKMLQKIAEIYGKNVCAPIRLDPMLAESPGGGQTIYEYAPGSIGANDYRELVRTVSNNHTLFR